jgi:signal transduction histidine kinase/CheY-like chemotaxis protein
MIEDSLGFIWLATDMGLNRFDKKTQQFNAFFYSEMADTLNADLFCYSLFLDSKHNMWVGTANGVAIVDPYKGVLKQVLLSGKNSNTEANVSVYSVIEQSDGIYWLGTSKGLVKYDMLTGQYRNWSKNTHNEEGPDRVLSLLLYNEIIWLAASNGFFEINTKTEKLSRFRLLPADQLFFHHEGFNSLMLDKQGVIWAGSDSKGLLLVDIQSRGYRLMNSNSDLEYPIKSNHIRYIFADNAGLIWVGTKFGGVFKYNTNFDVFGNLPHRFRALKSLSNKYTLSVYNDGDSIAWVGTKHEGLFSCNLQTAQIDSFVHDETNSGSISSNRINCIMRDSYGVLWIGTCSSVAFFDPKTNKWINVGSIYTNHIYEDSDSALWFASKNGIANYNRQVSALHWLKYVENNDTVTFRNKGVDILKIEEDTNGNLWFLSRQSGVYQLKRGEQGLLHFSYYPTENSKGGDNMVRRFLTDSLNTVWLGTKNNGLFKINTSSNEIVQFTSENGLPSNMVLNIENSNNDFLWLGTHSGITRFNKLDYSMRNFTSDFGIMSNICEYNASTYFFSEYLFFGGNNGFNIFHPDSITVNDLQKSLIITSVKVNDNEVASYLNQPQTIKLDYWHTYLSVEYTLPDYNNPLRHRFWIKLNGVDTDWNYVGNRNYVSYSNLKPGNYQLNIKGADEYGNVVTSVALLNIKVSKAYYQTWWFRLAVLAIVVLVVTVVYLQIRERQRKLEELINERTRKLEIAYKELLSKNTKIREQKHQIELHHQELEEKVAERTRDLEIAKRKAEESDRLKSSFLANMSHEIRTPLNAISGFSSLVSNDMYSVERKQKYVNIIKANVSSLLKLVEDILDISKIESGQLKIEKEFFDFTNMIAEVNAIFQEDLKLMPGKSVKLICENISSVDTIVEFNSDQVRIKQILGNLLSNALKFTKVGKVEFGYRLNEKSILMWVRDTGIGIKKEDIGNIFNRFIKIEEDKAIYRGTGLGLSISRSLSNLLNGRIWVESELGIGSSFYFEIPGEIRIIQNWQMPAKAEKVSNINLIGKMVLMVEPERTSYMLLHSFLISTKVGLVWAQNGKTALDFLKKQHFDFLILDLRLPDYSGQTMLAEIRKISPFVPVIAQTSYASPDEKKNLTTLGFSSLLIKPYNKDELLKAISQLF